MGAIVNFIDKDLKAQKKRLLKEKEKKLRHLNVDDAVDTLMTVLFGANDEVITSEKEGGVYVEKK